MNEAMNELMGQILIGLLSLLTTAILTLFAVWGKRLKKYMELHMSAKQVETFQSLAAEAYAFTESAYKNLGGHEKLAHALDYLEGKAREKGIPFEAGSAMGAIQKAWQEYEGKQKRMLSAPVGVELTELQVDPGMIPPATNNITYR